MTRDIGLELDHLRRSVAQPAPAYGTIEARSDPTMEVDNFSLRVCLKRKPGVSSGVAHRYVPI